MKLSLHLLCFYICIAPSQLANGQNCYYPNGDLSTDGDAPCTSEPGSACCPLNWECLSNGLCFNPAPNLQWFGRYTCTDPTWQSSGCPQICTHDLTAAGNEAVLECSAGSYCCDANRPDIDNPPQPGCCDTTPSRFSLPDGNVISSIGVAGTPSAVLPPTSTPTPTPPSSPSSTSAPPPPSPPSSTSTPPPPPPPSTSTPPSPSSSSTSTSTSTTSNTPTAIATPTPTPTSAPSSSPNSIGMLSNPTTKAITETPTGTTALSPAAASNSTTNTLPNRYVAGPKKLAIGLGVGLGILALAIIAAIVYGIIHHKRKLYNGRWSSSTLGIGFGGTGQSVGIEVKPQYYQGPEV